MMWKEVVMTYFKELCRASCEGLRETRKSSIRMNGLRADIWTWVSNLSLQITAVAEGSFLMILCVHHKKSIK
jgi:hypothetical protein